MANPITRLFKGAFNLFLDRDPMREIIYQAGSSYSTPRHRSILSSGTEMSIVSSVYNRCAIDVSMIEIRHVRVDKNEHYLETLRTGLNQCLTLSSNLDQSAPAFIQDVVMSLFDEGIVAIVPVDTSIDLEVTGSFDILSVRTGKIKEWFPRSVRIELYNDNTGEKEEVTLPKDKVAIIENPLYSVMNEPNSTLKRLIRKLNLLDAIDEQSGSGKLDIIVQLPYTIKSEARRAVAAQRLADIESQLKDSKHGVAYADGTEKIIQLNRPAENNLLTQIEYLTRMLYSQLGLSESIFDGTADEQTLLNYHIRTVYPVVLAITSELKRKFLTKTAITQGQSIAGFRNPFTLVTAGNLAELVDKFSRNEIMTGNEFRAVLGMEPSKDPSADELRNKNINMAEKNEAPKDKVTKSLEGETNQNGR